MNHAFIEPLETRIAPATLSIASPAGIKEGDSGATDLTFLVTLTSDATSEVTVHFSTADGTATTADNDFTPATGTLTFALGERSKEIKVPIVGDTNVEPHETFKVMLDTPTGDDVTLGIATATGTILNDDIPKIFIDDPTIVEGDSGTSDLVFHVTLSAASAESITVDFATADGTAKIGGLFPDYVTKAGALTFAPGETSKTIAVAILGDTFKEADNDTFFVNLSGAVNGFLSDVQGVGTIANGADDVVGIKVSDAATVEGDNPNINQANRAIFQVELSDKTASAVTFTSSTRNGTAIKGDDYQENTGVNTIAAGRTDFMLMVPIRGDAAFEATESFFVDLSNFSANVTPVGTDAGGVLHARGTIYNDDVQSLAGGRTVQWIDVDGDLVTLKISKGSLNTLGLVPAGSVGGRHLETLDLFAQRGGVGQFAGASISIVAEKQPGFPGVSDGRVDVGQIISAVILQTELQFIGVDLGVVTVDGDLGRIVAGDVFSTPAIARLDVFSLGAKSSPNGVESDVLGPIGSVHVASTLEGYLHVIGQEFGRIGTLRVDGAIKGGADPNSGSVAVTGRIGTVIVKDILGGDGVVSGGLFGNSNTGGSIGNVTVTGSIVGGAGGLSGKITAPRIGNVTVAGDVRGGTGIFSGGIGLDALATVRDASNNPIAILGATGSLGAVKIGGNLVGSTGDDSGKIGSGGNLSSATVLGSVIGGTGNGAGGIAVVGALGRLDVRGDVEGGDAPTGQTLNLSGFVAAGSIASGTIGRDLKAGVNHGDGISNSGVVRTGALGALLIGGDVKGSAANPAIISAIGNIKSVVIKGAVNFAEILAGYNNATAFDSPVGFRGAAVNPDAQIGSVVIEKSVFGLNIVAGASAGTGGRFGDATDVLSGGANSPRILSQIASVIFKGAILPNDASFGIVAQSIVSAKVGPTPVPLARGPGNDSSVAIGGVTNFRAVELHV